MEIRIHERAAERFNELGEQLLAGVVAEPRVQSPGDGFKPEVHFAANITSTDAIGPVTETPRVYDGTGTEVGRFFVRNTHRIGLVGEPFKQFRLLLERVQRSGLEETVSMASLTDAGFAWIEQKYDNRTTEPVVPFLLRQIKPMIEERELWIPVHRLHLEQPIAIGAARFQTISKQMLDELEAQMRANAPNDALAIVAARMERDRKNLQGSAAVAIRVLAEPIRASEVARERAEKGIALLRFFSPANWHPLMRSYCTLLGDENLRLNTEITVADGKISRISRGVHDTRNQPHWLLTVAEIQQFPNLLGLLNRLADETEGNSEFQTKLLEGLLLYSRNSVAREAADKLVYILASLESMLLRNDSEPIQKNIGERMAFLIGQTVEVRKAIVANVLETYSKRSSFVHHGQGIEATDTLATFMLNTWTCFYRMLELSHQFQTKEAFIQSLEDRKLQ